MSLKIDFARASFFTLTQKKKVENDYLTIPNKSENRVSPKN
jgi:hypothetical protein